MESNCRLGSNYTTTSYILIGVSLMGFITLVVINADKLISLFHGVLK